MKTELYYFSGTGNSLDIAKKIGKKIQNAELVSIPKVINKKEISGDVIGIICPIYMHKPPLIVVEFIKKIKSAGYIFFVFSGGGSAGTGISWTKRLFKKQGLHLDSLFNIAMPSNYTPYGCPDEKQQKQFFESVDEKINSIEKAVKSGQKYSDSNDTGFFRSYIFPGTLYKIGYRFIKKMDGQFHAAGSCDGCGTCEKLCPVNNIKIENNVPVWKHNCEQCYGCLQWCPKQAVEFGEKTAGISRYHHPDIRLKEIIDSASAR